MIYKSVSIKQVIGRVIRNTRLRDSSFIEDMNEWIPEAMGMLRTKVVLSPKWEDIDIDFHKGRLPCDLRTLSAVAYGGTRMRHNNGVPTYGIRNTIRTEPIFVTGPVSKIVAETISRKVYTADTTVGPIWSVDALVTAAGDIEVSTILHTDNLAANVASLNATLNALGYGTFTASWDGNLLTIEVNNDGTVKEITDIKYHQVTLDAPILLMVLDVNASSSSYYETNNLDTIVTLQQCMALPVCEYTYFTELDYINTSLCDGTVRIFYKAIPVDEEGYPLIPDNEDYKEALYWYVRAKMIGCGFIDRVFKYTDCMEWYNIHANKAIGQIKYPSIDQMETKIEISTRLILPDNYFESFFANPGKEGLIDNII